MIRPLADRVLVKLLPRYSEEENKLSLILYDGKKHFEGVRRGVVQTLGRFISDLKPGDIVWFLGDRGESFGMDERGGNDGTDWRRLSESDLLCVEEPV